MRVAFSSIALNTGSSSPGELEMTLNTSEVAVCCSSASSRSRLSNATFLFSLAADDLRRRTALGAMGGFSINVLRRRALTALPPALSRRFMPIPKTRTRHLSASNQRFDRGLKPASKPMPQCTANVRSGSSKADKPSWAKIYLCPLLSNSGQTRVRLDCPLSANSDRCTAALSCLGARSCALISSQENGPHVGCRCACDTCEVPSRWHNLPDRLT